MSQRVSITTDCGDLAAAQRAMLNVGGQFRPTPLGFTRSRALGTQLTVDSFPCGVSLTRISIGPMMVSVFAGLGPTPIGNEAYVKTLLVNLRMGDDKTPVAGVRIDGDPLSTMAKHIFGLRPTHMSETDHKNYAFCDNIVQSLVQILGTNADMHGCRVNSKKLFEFFGSGQSDSFLMDLFTKGPDMALKHHNINSLELVDDLDFEIGTGIPKESLFSATRAVAELSLARARDSFQLENQSGLSILLRATDTSPGKNSFQEIPASLIRTLLSGPSHMERPENGGNHFHFIRKRDCPLLESQVAIGRLDEPVVYFRPALRGYDCIPRNTEPGDWIRPLGAFLCLPNKRDSVFRNLEEFHRYAWNEFVNNEHKLAGFL